MSLFTTILGSSSNVPINNSGSIPNSCQNDLSDGTLQRVLFLSQKKEIQISFELNKKISVRVFDTSTKESYVPKLVSKKITNIKTAEQFEKAFSNGASAYFDEKGKVKLNFSSPKDAESHKSSEMDGGYDLDPLSTESSEEAQSQDLFSSTVGTPTVAVIEKRHSFLGGVGRFLYNVIMPPVPNRKENAESISGSGFSSMFPQQLAGMPDPKDYESALKILNLQPGENSIETIKDKYQLLVERHTKRLASIKGDIRVYIQQAIDDGHVAFTTITGEQPYLKAADSTQQY